MCFSKFKILAPILPDPSLLNGGGGKGYVYLIGYAAALDKNFACGLSHQISCMYSIILSQLYYANVYDNEYLVAPEKGRK